MAISMQASHTPTYTAFINSTAAQSAKAELIQLGAVPEDVSLIGSGSLEGESMPATQSMTQMDPPAAPSAEEFPDFRTPQGDVPSSPSDPNPLSTTPRNSGQSRAVALFKHLIDHGLSDSQANEFVKVTEEGGAVLSVKLPSGSLDHEEAFEVLKNYDGMIAEANHPANRTAVQSSVPQGTNDSNNSG